MVDLNVLASHLVNAPVEEPLTPDMEEVDPVLAKDFYKRVEVLRRYLALAENPIDLTDENQRRTIFAKLSYGFRKSGEYLSWITFQHRMAALDSKKSQSVAEIDGVHEFIAEEKNKKGREGKITDKVREAYKYLNKDVGAAMTRLALLEAMVEQLQTMKWEFSKAIDTLRAMAYGRSDADRITGHAGAVTEDE